MVRSIDGERQASSDGRSFYRDMPETVTYLFVPALEDRKVQNALASAAGAVIVDLEDAVPQPQKATARTWVASLLSAPIPDGSPERWIRINSSGPELALDVAAIDWSRAAGAVLPKAEDPAQIEVLVRAGVQRVLLLIESVRGMAALADLVHASDRVERLAIGTWDLALDLGLLAIDDPDDSELIWQLRGVLVFESRRLGLPPPVDGVCAALDDEARLRTMSLRAARLGFAGKLLVHPRQIAVAQSTFGGESRSLEAAREIVTAYDLATERGVGAIRVRGCLVDRVMVDRARALLERTDDAR
jgi:citrate lyase subunit beta/citryl-CoA lyase